MIGFSLWGKPRSQHRLEALPVKLLGRERRELRRIVKAATAEHREVIRAQVVLLAADGLSNSEIAVELDKDLKTVRKWRGRFCESRIQGLLDLPRSGRPPCFEASQRQEVFTLVTSSPPAPLARWTIALLAEHLVSSGIVPSISCETVSFWLRTAELKPHRVKYWLNSKDPDFRAKRDRVLELYLNPPKNGLVLCVDEKTSIQALERCHPEQPASRRRPRRVEFEYKRHGTVNLIASFEVHSGQVPVIECVERNDSRAFIGFCRKLLARYPRRKLYLILDNGTTHTSAETRRFFSKNKRIIPVFTPTHASWLNQIEIWFSALTRQTLKNVSFSSKVALIRQIVEYVAYHNRHSAKPYKWTTHGKPLVGSEVKTPRLAGRRSRSTPRRIRTASRYRGRSFHTHRAFRATS